MSEFLKNLSVEIIGSLIDKAGEFIASQVAQTLDWKVWKSKIELTKEENDFLDIYVTAVVAFSQKNKQKALKYFFKERSVIEAIYRHWYSPDLALPFYPQVEHLIHHFMLIEQLGNASIVHEELAFFEKSFREAVILSRGAADAEDHMILREGLTIAKQTEQTIKEGFANLAKNTQPVLPKNPICYLSTVRQPPLGASQVFGRHLDIDIIAQFFDSGGQLFLLTGMGGIGKSTLAGYYMEKYSNTFNFIAWVSYTGNIIDDCVREINDYKTLGYEPKGNSEEQFGELLRAMDRLPPNNLLIFDNLNTLSDLDDLSSQIRRIPLGWKVLVAAREHDERFPYHKVGVLSTEDTKKLFFRSRPLKINEDPKELDLLLELVGNHTLVVELLAKTITSQGWSISKMYFQLLDRGLTHLDTKVEVGSAHSNFQRNRMTEYVSTLFDINVKNLTKIERWVLSHLSVLPTWAHPYSLLLEIFIETEWLDTDNLFPTLQNLTFKGLLEKQYNRRLTHTILEREADEEDAFFMHSVLQEVIREKELPNCDDCEKMIWYFINKFKLDGEVIQISALVFPWIPYGQKLVSHLPEHELLAVLANNLSILFKDKRDLKNALLYQLKATSIIEPLEDKNNLLLATMYGNLSIIYLELDKPDEAIKYNLNAIEIREKEQGENHLDLARDFNVLSLIHKYNDDLDLAMQCELKAIEILNEGIDDSVLASFYSNLALIYKKKKDLDSALKNILKAISLQRSVIQGPHLELATTYYIMAAIYGEKGDLDKELEWIQESISILGKIYSEDDPIFVVQYNNLAMHYSATNEFDKALKWLQKSIKIQEESYGEENSILSNLYDSLGAVYMKMKNYKDAKKCLLRAIMIAENVFGEYSPKLAGLLIKLTCIYMLLNEDESALLQIRQAVRIYKRCYPDGHPDLDKALFLFEDLKKKT